jgi:sulfate permease, SulP family
MGKVSCETAAWGVVGDHPERTTIPDVLVLRLSKSLFWDNAARAKDQIQHFVEEHPGTAVVLDLESTDQPEITSADMLSLLLDRLRGDGTGIYVVRPAFGSGPCPAGPACEPSSETTTCGRHQPRRAGWPT